MAALLLRFGQPDLLTFVIARRAVRFSDNLRLICAIGVASSWSKDSAGAALAGAVGYVV
ncbi:hypothetical protein ACLK19_04610 [Escherichia coli]